MLRGSHGCEPCGRWIIGAAHDLRLGARAAAVAVVALAVALLVIAATDEGAAWPLRLGMLSAIAPVAGALGALAVVRLAAARGEIRALAAIGVDPMRAALGAATGGAIVGALGPVMAALGAGDLGALFPRSGIARTWIADAGGMREPTLGVLVHADGSIALVPPSRAADTALHASAMPIALATLAALAIVAPLWIIAAEGTSPWRRAGVLGVTVVLAIGAFQAVAAGRAPPWILLVAPFVLFLDAARARYRARLR